MRGGSRRRRGLSWGRARSVGQGVHPFICLGMFLVAGVFFLLGGKLAWPRSKGAYHIRACMDAARYIIDAQRPFGRCRRRDCGHRSLPPCPILEVFLGARLSNVVLFFSLVVGSAGDLGNLRNAWSARSRGVGICAYGVSSRDQARRDVCVLLLFVCTVARARSVSLDMVH